MEISCNRKRKQDSDNSDETALLKAKRNKDSELTAALLIEKLISAVEDENEDIVKSLLDEFFDTRYTFVKHWRSDFSYIVENFFLEKEENKFKIWRDAMYIAMEKDTKHSDEIMKLLLDGDIISSQETKMDELLLHRLIRDERKVEYTKNLRLIEMLLKSGKINVNARDESGNTALHLAEEEKLISLLIRYGADVNKRDKEGKTPLMPLWYETVSVLPTTLKETRTLMDLDAADCDGRTALMMAASDARQDLVELLLNAGASVNLSDHLGFTALHHALFTRFDHYDEFPRNSEELKKREEILALLFDVEIRHKGCHSFRKLNNRKERRIKIVEMLLQRPDIDVNVLSFEHFSPLDIAEAVIPKTPISIKDVLKEKGAVLNVFQQTETQSSSRFHLDVRCKFALQRLLGKVFSKNEEDLSVDLFEKRMLTLIEAFQDQIVSGKDQQGRTALHLVAISFSVVWKMPDDKLGNDGGKNADRELANLAHVIVKELITIGCNVNETDIYGRTPLHYADKIFKDSLISHGADASIKDKDGNGAIDEIPQQSSTNSYDIADSVKAVTDRSDETCFLRLMNSKEMEIEVQCVGSQVKEYDDVPRLLWENGEHAFRHPLVEKITTDIADLMGTIAKEIERLDQRFEIKPEFAGSSNEGTRLGKPDEFDFCFVLTKISELCEVSLSPELPTGFVRLKRKPTKVDETSEFDSFFGKGGILNTEKLKWQFTTILSNALVNIESQQRLDCYLEMSNREISNVMKKTSTIQMMKPPKFSFDDDILIDIVPCIHIDDWWPNEAISNVSDEIKKFGCNLIFDRPQEKLYPWVPYSESCARISFSKAESDMIKQSCDSAREAYMIGKTMVGESRLDTNYTLKNCLLYCIEALTPTSEKASQLGMSLEEMESKFHQMDRYLWLKCLMKCHLEFVSQGFCPCYFLPNFSSSIENTDQNKYSPNWMINGKFYFPKICKEAYALYRSTSNDSSELCCQLPAPDPLWERFDRNQLIAMLFKIAYK